MATETEASVTMQDVEDMKERREELAGKLADYREREEELSSELAHLHAEGKGESDEAADVLSERREVRETADDLDAALDVLDTRIEEATVEAARGEAGVEIASLRKRCGGIAGQHEKDVAKARELSEKLVETVRRVEKNRSRQLHLQALAEALADRFDLEAGEFKILPEGADDLSGLRERTARALASSPSLPEWEVAGVDLEPDAKALTAARALRKGWDANDCRAVELMELVDGELERDVNALKRAVRQHEQEQKEREALEWAMDWLDTRVSQPTPIHPLWEQLKEADTPPTNRSADKLLSAAARELGLVRVEDPSGNHHYAPAGFEPDGHYTPTKAFE